MVVVVGIPSSGTPQREEDVSLDEPPAYPFAPAVVFVGWSACMLCGSVVVVAVRKAEAGCHDILTDETLYGPNTWRIQNSTPHGSSRSPVAYHVEEKICLGHVSVLLSLFFFCSRALLVLRFARVFETIMFRTL